MAAIYYFFPDIVTHSAGIRILFRHVEVLVRHGFNASILHVKKGFALPDVPRVPTAYVESGVQLRAGDVVVVPEGYPNVMEELGKSQARRFAIALNWDYIYGAMPEGTDWRAMKMERAITHSPIIGDFISWSMELPVSVFRWGINSSLYYPTQNKEPEVAYLVRKQDRIEALKGALRSRDARFVKQIKWTPLQKMAEANYARIIRRAFGFINLSRAEGLPCSLLEAMRCRTLVAGYNSVGGKRELIGSGDKQNAILAETLDYVTLARKLEPALAGFLKGDVGEYQGILQNAFELSNEYDLESEESSIIAMWREFMGEAAPRRAD